MAGFTGYDDLINKMSASSQRFEWSFSKAGPAIEAAGHWASLWYAAGTPGAGADPASTPGTVYDNTAGSINFPNGPAVYKHLLTFGAVATVNCTLMLYDRLVAVGGISMVGTGDKTVNSSALTRYTTGEDAGRVEAWVELTTATTGTAPNINLQSYTNQAGVSAHAGPAIVFPAAATDVRWMARLPLQAGDKGVKSVETLRVNTAATAGVLNVVLLKPICALPLIANIWNERDLVLQYTSMPRLFDGASLAMMQLGTAATATNVIGALVGAYG